LFGTTLKSQFMTFGKDTNRYWKIHRPSLPFAPLRVCIFVCLHRVFLCCCCPSAHWVRASLVWSLGCDHSGTKQQSWGPLAITTALFERCMPTALHHTHKNIYRWTEPSSKRAWTKITNNNQRILWILEHYFCLFKLNMYKLCLLQ